MNDSITYYRAAISIENSSDIKIIRTNITRSTSTGIAFIDCLKSVELQKLIISFNGNSNKPCCFPAGISIEKYDPSPANYTIKDSQFEDNLSICRNWSSCHTNKSIYWRGGALGIFMGQEF